MEVTETELHLNNMNSKDILSLSLSVMEASHSHPLGTKVSSAQG